jgi:amino acid transporter
VWPLGEPTTAKGFFSTYVSVVAIIVIYIGAKIWFRDRRWVDTATIDLDAGRRFYRKQEIEYAEAKNKSWITKAIAGIWT